MKHYIDYVVSVQYCDETQEERFILLADDKIIYQGVCPFSMCGKMVANLQNKKKEIDTGN